MAKFRITIFQSADETWEVEAPDIATAIENYTEGELVASQGQDFHVIKHEVIS